MTTLATRETWTILSPIARPLQPAEVSSDVRRPGLDRPIAGVRVGFEIDFPWSSFTIVLDEWAKLLLADGADSESLRANGDELFSGEPQENAAGLAPAVTGIKTVDDGDGKVFMPKGFRADEVRKEEWAKLIDCGVVGLGN
jgi:hypothetical protein